MSACTGREIMTEVLGHLHIEPEASKILDDCHLHPLHDAVHHQPVPPAARRATDHRSSRRAQKSGLRGASFASCRMMWCSPSNTRSARHRSPSLHSLGLEARADRPSTRKVRPARPLQGVHGFATSVCDGSDNDGRRVGSSIFMPRHNRRVPRQKRTNFHEQASLSCRRLDRSS